LFNEELSLACGISSEQYAYIYTVAMLISLLRIRAMFIPGLPGLPVAPFPGRTENRILDLMWQQFGIT